MYQEQDCDLDRHYMTSVDLETELLSNPEIFDYHAQNLDNRSSLHKLNNSTSTALSDKENVTLKTSSKSDIANKSPDLLTDTSISRAKGKSFEKRFSATDKHEVVEPLKDEGFYPLTSEQQVVFAHDSVTDLQSQKKLRKDLLKDTDKKSLNVSPEKDLKNPVIDLDNADLNYEGFKTEIITIDPKSVDAEDEIVNVDPTFKGLELDIVSTDHNLNNTESEHKDSEGLNQYEYKAQEFERHISKIDQHDINKHDILKLDSLPESLYNPELITAGTSADSRYSKAVVIFAMQTFSYVVCVSLL